MALSNPELWSRIQAYDMPVPTRKRQHDDWNTFEAALQQEFEFSPEDAARLVVEYRKFHYLNALDGGRLSPPPDIEDVWQTHLNCPGEAWARFCQTVIGKPLDLQTGRSRAEAKAANLRAIDLYRQEFGNPPKDIWPGPAEDRRSHLGLAVMALGAVVLFGGTFAALAGKISGSQSQAYWVPYTFFGGLGIILLGAGISQGTRVNRG